MRIEKIKILISKLQPGLFSYSLFLICVLSGIALSFAFDSNHPDTSISQLILFNKPALFFRSLHYWSAQLFLIMIILHIFDHLLRKSELNQKTLSWVLMIIALPIILYMMMSGFLLRGDYDSIQAKNIILNFCDNIPFIGSLFSAFLFGSGSVVSAIYINHIVTSTFFVWLMTIEHTKKILPTAKSIIQILPLVILLSILFIPSINCDTSIVPKGPWYFVGIQELLHWISVPSLLFYFSTILLVLLFLLKYLKSSDSSLIKLFLFLIFCLYSILSIVGLFFRGDSWKLILPWKENPQVSNFLNIQHLMPSDSALYPSNSIPLIQGRVESCMYCHSEMKGLNISHDIKSIGCFTCHLGNPMSLTKEVSHKGMTLTSANMDKVNQTCGKVSCHSDVADRVNKSLMNTMSGVVSVNKFVFDETNNLNLHFNISKIKKSTSETHLRALCASCHLSNIKSTPGPITELTRGGGCSACHLNYSKIGLDELNSHFKIKTPKEHPDISIKINDKSCFGCHSRSGRISTNYEGWHETQIEQDKFNQLDKQNFRLLEDGRVFKKVQPDVHFTAGMSCIDCHSGSEVMGDGKAYSHEEEAVKIRCEDCHTQNPSIIDSTKFDLESIKILSLMKDKAKFNKYIATRNSKIPLINTFFDDKKINLVTKLTSQIKTIRPPSQLCGSDIKGHNRLDCKSCHTSWSPQCVGCHTSYNQNIKGWDNLENKEVDGSWLETQGDSYAEYPTLGVIADVNSNVEKISTFVPGMILSIDMNNTAKQKIFKRLYAPAFSHTIIKPQNQCKICHNNPVAMGFGRGELKLLVRDKLSSWSFTPKYTQSKADNLPMDAWIGFLNITGIGKTTRTNTRSFNYNELNKILRVGACFTCHDENKKSIRKFLNNFPDNIKLLPTKCYIPNSNSLHSNKLS